jgi:hypothetical protein
MEAYSFICHNYTGDCDCITLIGFSRGAFTARCIADLIHKAGLLTKSGLYYLTQLYKFWADGLFSDDSNLPPDFREKVLKDRSQLRRGVHIESCALWDTVSSLGLPRLGPFGPRAPEKLNFVNSDWCEGIEHVFQGLSLHEPRQPFLAIVLRPQAKRDLRQLHQCWFMGYHSDIGGGSKHECLAQFALAWMIARLDPYVEFDSKSFWEPAPQDSSWRLSLASGTDPSQQGKRDIRRVPQTRLIFFTNLVSVSAVIRDPRNLLYFFWGSKNREPRRHFWTGEGFSEVDPSTDDHNISGEFLHITVRILTKLKSFRQCPSLEGIEPEGIEPENPAGRWVWKLQPQQRRSWLWNRPQAPVSRYEVYEDSLTDVEKSLLERWLNSELDALGRRAEENDPPPDTLIPKLRERLGQLILKSPESYSPETCNCPKKVNLAENNKPLKPPIIWDGDEDQRC